MVANEPTVFVVDDDPALREALQWLLESEGFAVATYDSAEAFLAGYHPGQPGCLVLDVRMRGMSGLDLQARLVQEPVGLPIIIITGHGDVPMAVRAVKSGAVDFLEKPVSDAALLERVREALRLDAENRRQCARRGHVAARLARLTPRERQVMDRMVAGRANKAIALELGIAEKTVEVHRKRVLEKMGVRTAIELVHTLAASGRVEPLP